MSQPRVVVIDSYSPTRELVAEVLASEGYAVSCCTERGETTVFQNQRPDLVIMDLQHSSPDRALLLLDELWQIPSISAVPVIVTSTDRRLLNDLAEPLHRLGCSALEKPFILDELITKVEQALPQAACDAACDASDGETRHYTHVSSC